MWKIYSGNPEYWNILLYSDTLLYIMYYTERLKTETQLNVELPKHKNAFKNELT